MLGIFCRYQRTFTGLCPKDGGKGMRIIAGSARGRRLATLPGANTRPTLERVKEGMFSSVMPLLPGAAVLDLFAGSGQLGLEAVSRGAASCVFVDNAQQAAQIIRTNIEALGFGACCRMVVGDASAFLARAGQRFDVILLDPPYQGAPFLALLQQAAGVCAPGAVLLCEGPADAEMPETAAGLVLKKQYRYGTVQVCRYIMEGEGGA